MTRAAEFQPAWACPPGQTVRELASKKGLSSTALATALGLQLDDLNRLLDGVLAITPTRAEKLSVAVGASQRFWMARESQYRLDLQALKEDAREWVSSLPLADMRDFGWLGGEVAPSEKLHRALDFFGVSSVDEWRDAWLSERAGLTAYRTSPAFATKAASAAAWLRQGDVLASRMQTGRWSRASFEALLPKLKPLTRTREPSEFLPKLQSACAACGVAVVIVRAPKGCPASGATRVKNDRATLQLSFRFLRDDSFWFTFFHEAGHLVLHADRLFMEWPGKREMDEREEDEANRFATQFLIPPEFDEALRSLPLDHRSVMRFARDLGISPGIVVGQLQHRRLIGPERLNHLKKRYTWSEG